MYIRKIHILNYRNYNDFTMDFHNGLNVIIGANNSGKTGLLYAINLLNNPSNISVDDFNKNNLLNYHSLYTKEAPEIVIEYYVSHEIFEDDTTDESIVRLLPFLGIKEFAENRKEINGKVVYTIHAKIKATYSIDPKHLDEYKKEFATEVKDFNDYIILLSRFVDKYYTWKYTNGISDTKIEQKAATSVFDIRFIEAERTSEEVRKETRREIDAFTKDIKNAAEIDSLKKKVSTELSTILSPSTTKLANLFENEHNEIGLQKGNVAISSTIKPTLSVSDAYVTEVKDTQAGYTLPLRHNGLGYNNLINIYMLIKLTEIQKGRDFKILCLEEPEAHLHPAMQYKLFKYLRDLDKTNNLNQQIFVTTHSSNISAVAGIDNMFMLEYNRTSLLDCSQQSLEEQFKDKKGENTKALAKAHLTKFLDVTRSDMLFANKVILVEGIAEKLLMPLFMEICGCPYEDEHISIVEIGGKHFEHFIELFNGNNVKKKVLCITDCDFDWFDENGALRTYDDYISEEADHITKLKKRFNIDNLRIVTQTLGGRTFEDELFLSNLETGLSFSFFKKALCETLNDFFDKYKFDISEWETNKSEIDGRTKKTIEKYLNAFNNRIDKNTDLLKTYEHLIFAELFLHYAKGKKGDIALQILTDPNMVDENDKTKISVPTYIREGLEWLLK